MKSCAISCYMPGPFCTLAAYFQVISSSVQSWCFRMFLLPGPTRPRTCIFDAYQMRRVSSTLKVGWKKGSHLALRTLPEFSCFEKNERKWRDFPDPKWNLSSWASTEHTVLPSSKVRNASKKPLCEPELCKLRCVPDKRPPTPARMGSLGPSRQHSPTDHGAGARSKQMSG